MYTHTAVLNRLNLVLDYPLAGSGYLVLGIAVYMAVYTHVYTAVSTRSASICLQTLKVGANDRSAQELQNDLYNEIHTNFLTEVWPF